MPIIKHGLLGGITLTGQSAIDFKTQFIDNYRSTPEAQESLKRADAMSREYKEKGYVSVKVEDK